MTHDKIFQREDGTKFKVTVRLWVETIGDIHNYNVTVWGCKPKKRTWINVVDTDDYRYRALPMGKRTIYENNVHMEYVKPEEILEVKIELWNKLKPQ